MNKPVKEGLLLIVEIPPDCNLKQDAGVFRLIQSIGLKNKRLGSPLSGPGRGTGICQAVTESIGQT